MTLRADDIDPWLEEVEALVPTADLVTRRLIIDAYAGLAALQMRLRLVQPPRPPLPGDVECAACGAMVVADQMPAHLQGHGWSVRQPGEPRLAPRRPPV